MKFKAFKTTVAAGAVAALVAACGGGSDAPAAPAAPQTPAAGVVLGGVAATGLALANAPVTVKCSGGDGTTTTDASGGYSVTITGAALPCLVQVTGTVNGNSVVLHSVSEAGTADNGTTTARANVTPLTELIVAQLLGQAPAAAFETFATGSAPSITREQVTAAANAIVQAVKDATGIDLGSIDPLKATLVAATSGNASGGNDYDKLLDSLGEKLDVQALPLVVGQITSGTQGAPTLSQALSVAPGCPTAVSGRYRTVDLTGEVVNATFDFRKMEAQFDGHTQAAPVFQNPNQACDFSLGGPAFAENASWRFAIGPQGAGAFRGVSVSTSPTATTDLLTGYIFPAQGAATVAQAVGEWTFIESGTDSSEPDTSSKRVNWLAKLTIEADGKLSGCDYDDFYNWAGACQRDATDGETVTLVPGTDGALDARVTVGNVTETAVRLWSYRGPNGKVTLYGSSAVNAETPIRTALLLTKVAPAGLPAVGTVTKSLNFTTAAGMGGATSLNAPAPSVSSFTVTSVDAAAGTFVREGGASPETFKVDAPQTGMRTPVATPTRVQVLTDAGMTVVLDRPSVTSYRNTIAVGLPQ